MDTLNKRQQSALKTREKIIEASRQILMETGFDDVSVSDITAKAKVSTGSFYTYFKRKEDVIDELNRADFLKLSEIVNQMQDLKFIQRLEYYCTSFMKGIERSGVKICRQWIKNHLSSEKVPLYNNCSKFEYDTRALKSVFDEGIKRGELAFNTPVEKLVLTINAQLYGLMIIWCMTDTGIVGSDYTEEFISDFLNQLLKNYLK